MHNKRIRIFLAFVMLSSVLALSGCRKPSGGTSSGKSSSASEASSAASENSDDSGTDAESTSDLRLALDDGKMYTDRDMEQSSETDGAAEITLLDGKSSGKADGLTIDNETNTITITKGGVYIFTGSLSEGQICVDAEGGKVEIVLNGCSIANDTSPAIYVKAAKKTFVTLAENSENSLSVTGTFAADGDTKVDGVIFSKDDLTVKGTGSVKITSAEGHGIVCKDDLRITGGTISISAKKKGISGKDSIRIGGGTIAIDSTDDGLNSGNDEDDTKGWVYISGGELSIASGDDGIHADTELRIDDGTVTVTKSYEGLESQVINVTGGTIDLTAEDDGLNASSGSDSGQNDDPMAGDDSCVLNISGGTMTVDADGDGIDSNGSLHMSGGMVYVAGPTNDGNGPLDYGTSAAITGGTILAVGSSGMGESFGEDSTQGVVMTSVDSTSEKVTVTDSDGNTIASFDPGKEYTCVIVSAPSMNKGGTVTIETGSASKSVTLDSDSFLYSDVQNTMGGGAMGRGGMGGPGGQGGSQGSEGAGGPGNGGGPGGGNR